ncbi:hypothetical protein [Sorangium sp. So ce1182]|uniref:hypothetical protein n=1 Tax=Sorangium sp. So ce1182 TaxID=3133334 RepID=UPI003F609281
MADPSHHREADLGLDRGSTPPTPRWVKAFGAIIVVLVVLFAVLHLTGRSLGGPGSHTPSGGLGGHTPSGHGGHAPPEGGRG